MNDTLKEREPHPASYSAKRWVSSLPPEELSRMQEALSSCAIEGNRMAEVCSGTLNRLMMGQPVSDRYIMGLAWFWRYGKEEA